jgi:hypothetical protein
VDRLAQEGPRDVIWALPWGSRAASLTVAMRLNLPRPSFSPGDHFFGVPFEVEAKSPCSNPLASTNAVAIRYVLIAPNLKSDPSHSQGSAIFVF